MNNKSINPRFYGAYFEKHIEFKKCPFFLLWIHDEILKAYNIDIKVKRKGLPKSGPRPMVRHKRLLALARILDGFTLKGFAEDLSLSYGVIRLWNREPRVIQESKSYILQFAVEYSEELIKRMSSKKLNLEKHSYQTYKKADAWVKTLLYEAKHYPADIQLNIMTFLDIKNKSLPAEQSFMLGATIYKFCSIVSNTDIYNPPKDKTRYELKIKMEGEVLFNLTKGIFSGLKKKIKNGETKSALNFIDDLERRNLYFIEDITELKISVLNKGKRKEEIRFGKEKEAH